MSVHTVYAIQAAVELAMQLRPGAIRSKSRRVDYVKARKVAMALADEYCPHMTTSDLGYAFGYADHSTACYLRKRVEAEGVRAWPEFSEAGRIVEKIVEPESSSPVSTTTGRVFRLVHVDSVGK